MSHACEPRQPPTGFLARALEASLAREQVLRSGAPAAPSLRGAVERAVESEARPALIIEYKRCRPSGFVRHIDPWSYVDAVGGAADAWSVLVEPFWFCGSPELLPVFASTGKPVLAKDFAAGREQLRTYRRMGASAVLLILDMLGWRRLEELYEEARGLGLEALIETTDWRCAVEAMNSFPGALVGINARNLETLEVSFERLLEEVRRASAEKPSGGLLVAESSVDSVEKARRLAEAGADALLIGTWSMKNPGELRGLPAALRGAREK